MRQPGDNSVRADTKEDPGWSVSALSELQTKECRVKNASG